MPAVMLIDLLPGYTDTLKAFIAEKIQSNAANGQEQIPETAALPFELQQLVEHYLNHDGLYEGFRNLSITGTTSQNTFDWYSELKLPLPTRITRTIRDAHLSGVLSVTYCELPRRNFSTQSACYRSTNTPCIVTTSVDKRIVFTNTTSWDQEDAYGPLDSVALVTKCNPKYPWLMAVGNMDGSIVVVNLLTRVSQKFKMHSK